MPHPGLEVQQFQFHGRTSSLDEKTPLDGIHRHRRCARRSRTLRRAALEQWRKFRERKCAGNDAVGRAFDHLRRCCGAASDAFYRGTPRVGADARNKSIPSTRSFCATPVSITSATSIASPSASSIEDKARLYLVVADGRFDRKKINTYTSQFGAHESRGGREIFTVPVSGSTRKISFAFLRQNRIALTDNADLPGVLAQHMKGEDEKEWHARFERLAGSPLFAAIRQDSATSTTLASQAPGGFQSPQLSALIDQLQWVTIAGKPEGDRLRVVVEGECPTDAVSRQLSDFLNGVLILAQAGLNGPHVREQLDPQAREAYLEIAQGRRHLPHRSR